MLPPKPGHILGCLALSEFFFCQKKTLPRPNHFFKIQWEINFFSLFEILTEIPHTYLQIFRLTTFQSRKMIPKADLK